jgi:hypothetical protein
MKHYHHFEISRGARNTLEFILCRVVFLETCHSTTNEVTLNAAYIQHTESKYNIIFFSSLNMIKIDNLLMKFKIENAMPKDNRIFAFLASVWRGRGKTCDCHTLSRWHDDGTTIHDPTMAPLSLVTNKQHKYIQYIKTLHTDSTYTH